jgi:putative SOS response-associated peptidase YedK
MNNRVSNIFGPDQLSLEFSQVHIRLRFPEGAPNIKGGDFKISDKAAIVRTADEPGLADCVLRPWSWKGDNGRPLFNWRSEGREFRSNRCLIPVDAFYEYKAPDDPAIKKKQAWRFTKMDGGLFCIAGFWRETDQGEAFTMLTTNPNPDVKPYHHRQVAILDRPDWARWLDHQIPAREILHIWPAGTLRAEATA